MHSYARGIFDGVAAVQEYSALILKKEMVIAYINGAEIIKYNLDAFEDIQEYIMAVKEENTVKTYTKLKKKYR